MYSYRHWFSRQVYLAPLPREQVGGLGIHQFHGVKPEFFTITPETHRTFLAYLRQQQAYWVTTFSAAMQAATRR